jgi:hypothetical protein
MNLAEAGLRQLGRANSHRDARCAGTRHRRQRDRIAQGTAPALSHSGRKMLMVIVFQKPSSIGNRLPRRTLEHKTGIFVNADRRPGEVEHFELEPMQVRASKGGR